MEITCDFVSVTIIYVFSITITDIKVLMLHQAYVNTISSLQYLSLTQFDEAIFNFPLSIVTSHQYHYYSIYNSFRQKKNGHICKSSFMVVNEIVTTLFILVILMKIEKKEIAKKYSFLNEDKIENLFHNH